MLAVAPASATVIAMVLSTAVMSAPSTTLGRSVLLNGCAFIPATLTQQIGADIIGENPEDKFGIEVALSADGNTLAVGARDNDGGGTNSGHVRAYRRVSNAWLQLGSDIDGEAADDRSGNAIALSADGNIMAIGADENDGGGTNTGSVRIYQFIGGDWSQLGSDLDGEFAYDYFGYSVSLSSDGATLAVGSLIGESSRGYTRPYPSIPLDWWSLVAVRRRYRRRAQPRLLG